MEFKKPLTPTPLKPRGFQPWDPRPYVDNSYNQSIETQVPSLHDFNNFLLMQIQNKDNLIDKLRGDLFKAYEQLYKYEKYYIMSRNNRSDDSDGDIAIRTDPNIKKRRLN